MVATTPEAYGRLLCFVLADRTTLNRLPEPIVFIIVSNDWDEDNHVEPEFLWVHRYLEQIYSGLAVS
jgi:hypothetical protein